MCELKLTRLSTGRVKIAKHATTGQFAAVKIVPKQLISPTNASGPSAPRPLGSSPAASPAPGTPGVPPAGETAREKEDREKLEKKESKMLLGIEREIVIMKVSLEIASPSLFCGLILIAIHQLIDHPNVMNLYDVWETESEL